MFSAERPLLASSRMTLQVMQEGMVGWLESVLILRVEGRFRIWRRENTVWGKGDSVWSSSRKVICILEGFFFFQSLKILKLL